MYIYIYIYCTHIYVYILWAWTSAPFSSMTKACTAFVTSDTSAWPRIIIMSSIIIGPERLAGN